MKGIKRDWHGRFAKGTKKFPNSGNKLGKNGSERIDRVIREIKAKRKAPENKTLARDREIGELIRGIYRLLEARLKALENPRGVGRTEHLDYVRDFAELMKIAADLYE